MASEQWPTLIGALGGALIGAGAAYTNQAIAWRRQRAARWDESRREAYARFLGSADAYFLALMDLRWSLINDPSQVERAGREAHQRRSQSRMSKAELDIIAGKQTREAADNVASHLSDINMALYSAQRNATLNALSTWRQHDEQYRPIADLFVATVNEELA